MCERDRAVNELIQAKLSLSQTASMPLLRLVAICNALRQSAAASSRQDLVCNELSKRHCQSLRAAVQAGAGRQVLRVAQPLGDAPAAQATGAEQPHADQQQARHCTMPPLGQLSELSRRHPDACCALQPACAHPPCTRYMGQHAAAAWCQRPCRCGRDLCAQGHRQPTPAVPGARSTSLHKATKLVRQPSYRSTGSACAHDPVAGWPGQAVCCASCPQGCYFSCTKRQVSK